MTPEKREFKEAFIQLLPKAWQRVSEMLESTADFDERRFAVQTVMDRSYGKVVERKELSGPDGGKIPIEDTTPSIRLCCSRCWELSRRFCWMLSPTRTRRIAI